MFKRLVSRSRKQSERCSSIVWGIVLKKSSLAPFETDWRRAVGGEDGGGAEGRQRRVDVPEEVDLFEGGEKCSILVVT